MNTANLANSRRLYELSGWDDCHNKYRKNGYLVTYGFSGWLKGEIPAYDLGFMLRKLPEKYTKLETDPTEKWIASYFNGISTRNTYAPTPEDACALLLIKLIEDGVLTNLKEQ